MKNKTLAEKLKILADDLAQTAYDLTFDFPKIEQYALSDQIRRSLLSVPSNIYEGLAHITDKSKRRYLNIAYGSLAEFRYQIYFAFKRKYIDNKTYSNIKNKADELSKLMYTFIKKLTVNCC